MVPEGGIVVKFTLKQALSGNSSSQAGDEEQEVEDSQVFEVSSVVRLQAGRAEVVGAKRIHGRSLFLILHADI